MQQMMISLKESWNKLSRPMQIGGGLLIAGVFLSLLLLAFFSSTEYQPLFTKLPPEDAAAVISYLGDNGIPYQLVDNGATVMVPTAAVHETRLALASHGIPRGGVVGFEIFESTRLGETEADRQLRFLWALQGELTRTIRELNGVDDARIHLVMPRRSLFIQDSQPATASVLLNLRPGVLLSSQQVRGIAHLIATSVEGLTPEKITIVDNRGNVLNDSAGFEGLDGRAIAQQMELEKAYERQLENSAIAMLERIYGYGNVIVRVSADLDFDLQEEFSEIYEPVTRDGGIIRSEQIFTESLQGDDRGIFGVPGVDTNVPGYVATSEPSGTLVERSDITRNYEINRTERRYSATPGKVQRLSVAVWINGELTPVQLASIEDSVAMALGIRLDRGDEIFVDSSLFESEAFLAVAPDFGAAGPTIPLWAYIAIPLTVLGLGLMITRRRRQQPVAETSQVDIAIGNEEEETKLDEPHLSPAEKRQREVRKKVLGMAKDKPKEVANLLKNWIADE